MSDDADVSFFAPGIPQPGGSKRAFTYKKKDGSYGARVEDDAKRNKPWRTTVQGFALQVLQGRAPLEGPLLMDIVFVMPRPQGHFGAKGNVRPSAPSYPTTRPDATKLLRSTEDALLGVLYKDDSQIVDQHVRKVYGARPGAQITVRPMPAG